MKPFPPKRTESEPVPFLRSPLNVALLVLGLVLVSVAVNGYLCFRTDHLSQIPLIFIQSDPDLFPRDWFFQNFGHFKLRFLHLVLIKSLAWAVGIPIALMFWYVICVASVIGAWLAIARHIYGSILPGLVAALLGIIFYGEVGANHLIERILIPRAEAFAIIYWGVLCLFMGRAAFAGLLFGFASCFQPAVGIQFGIPLLIWVWVAGEPDRLRRTLWFLGCYAVVLLPWLAFLGDSFTGESNLTDEEVINVVAWLRHPQLMLPRFFGRTAWVDFFLLLIGSIWAWRQMSRHNERIKPVGWILPIMAGLLLLATFFIEVVPVKIVVMFQPFRASVLLYLMMFLMLGPYLLGLLQSEDPFRRFRGVLLLFSVYVLKLMGVLIMVEFFLAWREWRGRSQPKLEALALAAMTVVGGFLIEVEVGGRTTTWLLLALAVAGTAALHGLTRARFFEKPRAMRTALAAFALLGFGLMGSAFALPWSAWVESENPAVRTRAARTIWRYQIDPVPVKALERLGVWARENTPKDALFLIPPQKTVEGFRIWSLRSVVFNVKHFPVTQVAYEEWRRRYLAVRGVLDPDDPAMADEVEEALSDYYTQQIDEAYAELDETTLLALAGRYEAGYVITPTRYDSSRLELLHSDFDRTADDPESQRLYLFRVRGG